MMSQCLFWFCVCAYVVPDSMIWVWSTSSNWKSLSQRSTLQLSHKKRGTFCGRAGISYAAAASPHTSQYPCWWGPLLGIPLLIGQSCMLCWMTLRLGTRWMPLPYWRQGGYSTYMNSLVHTHTYFRVFTLKPVPNWINWNRFTELGFDDLLAFTPEIWSWFRLHVLVSGCDDMDPFLMVCALLWVTIMLFRSSILSSLLYMHECSFVSIPWWW